MIGLYLLSIVIAWVVDPRAKNRTAATLDVQIRYTSLIDIAVQLGRTIAC